MKKLLIKILKVILIALATLIVLGIGLAILFVPPNTSGYTKEELRIICNDGRNLDELGVTWGDCMSVW
jgi:hypothetical protein